MYEQIFEGRSGEISGGEMMKLQNLAMSELLSPICETEIKP